PSKTVTIEITLWDQSQKVYTETHSATSDALGYIAVPLGKGMTKHGVIKNVNWDKEVYIEVDIDGVKSAKTELYTIPKSFYATKAVYADSVSWAEIAKSIDGIIFDDDKQGTNIYWSSEKVYEYFDSVKKLIDEEREKRIQEDERLYDSIVTNRLKINYSDVIGAPIYTNASYLTMDEPPLDINFFDFIGNYFDFIPCNTTVFCNIEVLIFSKESTPIVFNSYMFFKSCEETDTDIIKSVDLVGTSVIDVNNSNKIKIMTQLILKGTKNLLDDTVTNSIYAVFNDATILDVDDFPNISYYIINGFVYHKFNISE
ncbi:MAG: hypothetical protein LBG17_08145, partial [Bacteroidales bacterium]|nr:hypothetical protein [Bacteroidales bacterium]